MQHKKGKVLMSTEVDLTIRVNKLLV